MATINPDHWQFFNYDLIMREAKERLREARSCGHDKTDSKLGTLEYWCAHAAHANVAACLIDSAD